MAIPKLEFSIQNNALTIKDGFELPKYTILVGKNNSGKSWLLTTLYHKLQQNQDPLKAYYISPERFGALQRNTSLEDANFSNRIGKDKEKLNNQSAEFITEAISSFNGLVGQLNRPPRQTKTLNSFLENLNNKITGLIFTYTGSSESTSFNFKINDKYPDPNKDKFSSGTNQIIALMTSVMYFLYSAKYATDAVLFLDEPDVHIHSDLQDEFIKFLIEVTKKTDHKIIIATHSSSIIAGFNHATNAYISTRNDNGDDSKLDFYKINSYINKLLPSIGSHSLSHVFNKSPLLLVEGDDDELVWQYAIRNSGQDKLINFHIINTGSKTEMPKYEKLILNIGGKLFNNPKVYELRDKDNSTEALDNISFMERSYLDCNEIENLILSNEVLKDLGYPNYDEALDKLKNSYTVCRLQNHPGHDSISCKICKLINDLTNSTFDRYTANLKGSENDIPSKLKPDNRLSWEVLVGKNIGRNIINKQSLINVHGSVYHMLGEKISSWIG